MIITICVIILIIQFVLYCSFGYSYAKGIAEYTTLNRIKPSDEENVTDVTDITESESCWQSVLTEYAELKEAITDMDLFGAFLELYDVIITLIKYNSVTYLPPSVFCSVWYWSIIFFFVTPGAIKFSLRYKKYDCIRNHFNKNNLDHICNYKRE